jgi:hypothetical protein
MADHLTSEMIEGYRARSLKQDQLLAATEHLAKCEECRQNLASRYGAGTLLEALGGQHLSYEDLEAIVHGGREGLDHVADCAMCSDELRDLQAFRAGLPRSGSASDTRRSRVRVFVPVGALAIAALVLAGLFLRSGGNETGARVPQAHVGQPEVIASLRDSGRVLAVDKNGAIFGIDEVAPAERNQIANVLRSGKIPVASPEPELLRSQETLLGSPAASANLIPVAPAGTVVLSDYPAFHWQAPGNARDFRVTIYDSNFELVESSGTVQGKVWISTKPLPRGKVFSWTVSAAFGGTRITAPHSPEPEARFRVASAEEVRDIESARHAAPASDLRLALTAARLGFRDEAREALRHLEMQNPGSSLAQRLLESLPSN